ncbi:MAG: NAD-dependent epimerase/dehydratase family protein [Deltaproteobacteria bacterium]|nr:MAG: NAD-dependent epimerase/dehydratase family protein [Deltaproteobacteria bacterium]
MDAPGPGSRILVTGGVGFIGSHLVEALRARGCTVVVVDNFDGAYPLDRKWANARAICRPGVAGDVRLVRGDIRDEALLADVLGGVDAVMHLAALAGVRDSLRDPARYVDVNVGGTQRLLQAMERAGCRRLVFASSSSVYGEVATGRFTEDLAADRPVSPYAATKRTGELLIHAAHVAWGLDATCLRFFTVYGPRQRPGMAIARFVQLARQGAVLPLFGDGSSVRDYTFVTDAVAGLLAALDRPLGYEVINLGCGTPVRLDHLVDTIGRVLGKAVQVAHLPVQTGDVARTHAAIDKAARLLDWRPQVSLEEGLHAYIDWARATEGW